MAATQPPAIGLEYRLNMLDLPRKIEEMVLGVHTPSSLDRQYLKDAQRGYEKTLQAIEAAVNLETQSDSHLAQGLRHVMAIARHRIMACTSVFAAWRKLPVELWDMIFATYLGEVTAEARERSWRELPKVLHSGHYGLDILDHRVFGDIRIDFAAMCCPYPLLSVCQVWRKLVSSTPSIWSRVAIAPLAKDTALGNMPFLTSVEASRLASRLTHVGSNRAAWSLSIAECEIHPDDSHLAEQHILPLSSVFSRAYTLWSSVERLKILVLPSIVPYLGQHIFPSTSSLVLYTRGTPDQERLRNPPKVPNLRKAVLVNAIDVMANEIPQNIPWSQLTHLLMGSLQLEGEHIRGFLQVCTSLHHASFFTGGSVQPHPHPTWSQTRPATLQFLRTLDVISNESRQHLSVPFVKIGFPVLSTIRIFTRSDNFDNAHIARYMRPFHLLTHLTLVFVRATRGAFLADDHHYNMGDVLDACPFLVELVASYQGDLDPFFETMVFSGEAPRGCHLKALSLLVDVGMHMGNRSTSSTRYFYGDPYEAAFPLLRNIVASRRKAMDGIGSPALLERFIITFTNGTNLDPYGYHNPFYDLKNRAEFALHPFVKEGLKALVEVTPRRLQDFMPVPSGNHWDEGALDILDNRREYTTDLAVAGRWQVSDSW